MQDALIVVRQHIGDEGLAGVEVVADLFHGIVVRTLLHLGLAFPFSGQGVQGPARINDTRGHVILHIIRGQGHVLVLHLDAAVVVDEPFAVGEVFDDGVAGRGENRHGDRALGKHCKGVGRRDGIPDPLRRTLRLQGIEGAELHRIGDGLRLRSVPAGPRGLTAGSSGILGRSGHAGQEQQDQRDKYGYRLLQMQLFANFAKYKCTYYLRFTKIDP